MTTVTAVANGPAPSEVVAGVGLGATGIAKSCRRSSLASREPSSDRLAIPTDA